MITFTLESYENFTHPRQKKKLPSHEEDNSQLKSSQRLVDADHPRLKQSLSDRRCDIRSTTKRN